MTRYIRFLASAWKKIANYPGILTLNPFINAKRITHALYQNMGDLVANLANYDTGGRCTLQDAIVGAFAPAVYRAIMALCRCTDAANGQMLDVF